MKQRAQKAIRSSSERHSEDFYATDPQAVRLLLKYEKFHHKVLEPCCGMGHISKVLIQHNYEVISADKNDYGYGIVQKDFLAEDDLLNGLKGEVDIVTNPPYYLAVKMVEKALLLAKHKVAMLFPFWYIVKFYWYPPRRIYLFTRKINIAKDGDFEAYHGKNMKDYAWFIFDKGYKGSSTIHYINNNKRVSPIVEELETTYMDESKFWNSSKENMQTYAIQLHKEGVSNRAIAKRLEVSEGTVRNWLKISK